MLSLLWVWERVQKTAVWTSFVHFEEVPMIQFFQKLEKLFSLMHHHKNPGISMKMACDLTMWWPRLLAKYQPIRDENFPGLTSPRSAWWHSRPAHTCTLLTLLTQPSDRGWALRGPCPGYLSSVSEPATVPAPWAHDAGSSLGLWMYDAGSSLGLWMCDEGKVITWAVIMWRKDLTCAVNVRN